MERRMNKGRGWRRKGRIVNIERMRWPEQKAAFIFHEDGKCTSKCCEEIYKNWLGLNLHHIKDILFSSPIYR